jgi:hypothetical protein
MWLHLPPVGLQQLGQAHAEAQKILEFLTNQNVDVNATDESGRTALMFAAGTGLFDVARVLVDAGPDINIEDKFGKNAMNKCLGSSSSMKRHSVKLVKGRELASDRCHPLP